jgi:hypothetical protein
LSLAVGVWVWCSEALSIYKGASLLLMLEGTVLLASAFTPKGLVPPPKGIAAKLHWFLNEPAGVPVAFNQSLFYVGVLFLLAGSLLSNITG